MASASHVHSCFLRSCDASSCAGPQCARAKMKKRILVVEDYADIREYLAFVLRGVGYDVLEAENGKDALDQLESLERLPCLLVLDIMMPIMSGPELLNALSHSNRLARIPVVVLSAGGQPADAPDVHRFLRKPADAQLVLNAVREVCGPP